MQNDNVTPLQGKRCKILHLFACKGVALSVSLEGIKGCKENFIVNMFPSIEQSGVYSSIVFFDLANIQNFILLHDHVFPICASFGIYGKYIWKSVKVKYVTHNLLDYICYLQFKKIAFTYI